MDRFYLADDPTAVDREIEAEAAATAAMSSQIDTSVNTGKDVSTMKHAMMESAAKVAAVQLGVSIGLMFVVPPIGTIIGAVLAIIQLFSSSYVKSHTKVIIADGVAQAQRMIAQTQDELMSQAMQVAADQYPGAQALAASGEPLGGVDGFADVLRKIAKPIAKPVARAAMAPVKYAGKAILKVGIINARLVGDKKFEQKLEKAYGKWDEKSRSFETYSTRLAGDPVQLIRELHTKPFKLLTGTEQLDVARKKIRSLLASLGTQLADKKAKGMAVLASQDYKDAVQLYLAKTIRNDPVQLARAQDLARLESQTQSTMDRALDAANTGQPSIGGWLSSLFSPS